MLVVKHFNTDFLTQKKKYYKNKYSRSIRQNTKDFIEWIKKILRDCVPVLPEGYNYNSQAIRLNQENLSKISKHIFPMDFLNFAPTTDDTLKSDELGIELSTIIIKDNQNI